MKYKRKPIIFSFCEIFRDWKTVDQDIVEMIKEKIPIMLQNNNVACENYTVIFTPDFVYNDSDAIYKYNTEHHTCHGKCICRMFDDQPAGSITEDEIFDYLGNVVDKLHRFIDHYKHTI